jgi:hypothetical protein
MRHRHRRHRQYIDWITVRCPICNRLVPSWTWLLTLTVLTGLTGFGLIEFMNAFL